MPSGRNSFRRNRVAPSLHYSTEIVGRFAALAEAWELVRVVSLQLKGRIKSKRVGAKSKYSAKNFDILISWRGVRVGRHGLGRGALR
jgi:hypothetical protein